MTSTCNIVANGRLTRSLAPLLGAALGFAPAGSYAMHDSSPNADNKDHDSDWNDIEPDGADAIAEGEYALDTYTEMHVHRGRKYDVHNYDGYYGPYCNASTGTCTEFAGMSTCIRVNWWNSLCDQWDVRYNLRYSYSNNSSWSFDEWKAVGCHEFGHTVGIGHRNNSTDRNRDSCMNADGSELPAHPWFDSHDVNEINADH